MTDTTMAEAMKRAGVKPAADQFAVACYDALRRHGKSAVRAVRDQALKDALVKYLYALAADMEGTQERRDGVSHHDSDSQRDCDRPAPAPNGGGVSRPHVDSQPQADRAAASRTPAETSQPLVESQPGYAPSPPAPRSRISKTAAKAVARAQTIHDIFHITERQGSKTPIGDITIARLDRMILMLEKRTWVTDKERHTVILVRDEARRQAHIPRRAKIRDVVSPDRMEELITMAARMAQPRLPDETAAEASREAHHVAT